MEDGYEETLFEIESSRLTEEYHKAMNALVLFKEELKEQRKRGVRASTSEPPIVRLNERSVGIGFGTIFHVNNRSVFCKERGPPEKVLRSSKDRVARPASSTNQLSEYDFEGNLVKRRKILTGQHTFEGKIVEMSDKDYETEDTIGVFVSKRERKKHRRVIRNLCRNSEGKVVITKKTIWNSGRDGFSNEDDYEDGESSSSDHSFITDSNCLHFYHKGKYIPYVYDHESVDGHVTLSFSLDGEEHKYRVSPGYDVVLSVFFFNDECYYVASCRYSFDDVYGFQKYDEKGKDFGDEYHHVIHARTMKKCPYFNDVMERQNDEISFFHTEDHFGFYSHGRLTFLTPNE